MGWKILVLCFIFSFIILVPLGIKWEIERKVIILGAFFIGALSGLIVSSILGIYNLNFYQILILEFFLIIGISISLLLWRFYRDPERIAPEDENGILSPADGRVIYIKEIIDGTVPFSEKNGKKFPLEGFRSS